MAKPTSSTACVTVCTPSTCSSSLSRRCSRRDRCQQSGSAWHGLGPLQQPQAVFLQRACRNASEPRATSFRYVANRLREWPASGHQPSCSVRRGRAGFAWGSGQRHCHQLSLQCALRTWWFRLREWPVPLQQPPAASLRRVQELLERGLCWWAAWRGVPRALADSPAAWSRSTPAA